MTADQLYTKHKAAIDSAVSDFVRSAGLPPHLTDELQSLAVFKFIQLVPMLRKRTDIHNETAYVRKAIRNDLCDRLSELLDRHTAFDVDFDELPSRISEPSAECTSTDAVQQIRLALWLACRDALDCAIVECLEQWENAAKVARHLGISADVVEYRRFRVFFRLPRSIQRLMTTRPVRRIERFLTNL